jgi:hypothetical protein
MSLGEKAVYWTVGIGLVVLVNLALDLADWLKEGPGRKGGPERR